MDLHSEPVAGLAFGRFRALPHRRELLADGQPIKLGGRAFDVLLALIEARGTVVSKHALMARVWPGQIVEENTLQSQLSALRGALGAERELIRTVSRRGYQFTGEIRLLAADLDEHTSVTTTTPGPIRAPTNLPEPVSELIGRDDDLHDIVDLVARHRLITLTGAGGIGKTRLALAVGRRLLPQFADGVWLADLAPLAGGGLVAGAVAAAVGLELAGGAVSPDRVAAALGGKQLLLVLDNCEHVVDAATIMAEALLLAGPAVHVIATSREPLKAEGEAVYPVRTLTVPAEDARDEGDPFRYGAVRLFLDRARAAEPRFAPDLRLATLIAAICRRLDGIPLAIELAAVRAATLGVEVIATRLDDRFQLLTGGRRTALPRHKTLRATLDWSYELLVEPERVVLRRLAVFAGSFRLEAAHAIVASPDIASPSVIESLLGLMAKSLVSAEVGGSIARYRLLDTTRAYAFEKLGESGEMAVVARRHAEYYRDLFERAEAEWRTRPSSEFLSTYGANIDNVRAALDWAFSPGGDASIGVALTVAAVPLWMQLSLLDECRGRAEQALTSLDAGTSRDARREMKLHAAVGSSLTYSRRAAAPETCAAWTKALEIAESLNDAEYQLRSLWGLWVIQTSSSRHRAALALAQRFHTLAATCSDLDDQLVGERLLGASQHYLGDQPVARRHLERFLAGHEAIGHPPGMIRFPIDVRVTARVVLAWVLWLLGLPDQAMRAAERSIDDARAANHAFSLCYALALGGCQIAALVGDLATAEQYVGMLLDHSTRHGLTFWRAFGTCHQGGHAIKRGDVMTGLSLLRAGRKEVFSSGPASQFVVLLMTEAFGEVGQVLEGLEELNEAIERSEQAEECSLIAELLRLKGEFLLLQGAPGAAAAAEDHFRKALDRACLQCALSLELRAATSLARLLRDEGRSAEAKALLQPVYDRFTEGFDTTELKTARAVLDSV
jgi:predicted ATPase/DNA-binding winged helix-turn-helix (wHTH) protein